MGCTIQIEPGERHALRLVRVRVGHRVLVSFLTRADRGAGGRHVPIAAGQPHARGSAGGWRDRDRLLVDLRGGAGSSSTTPSRVLASILPSSNSTAAEQPCDVAIPRGLRRSQVAAWTENAHRSSASSASVDWLSCTPTPISTALADSRQAAARSAPCSVTGTAVGCSSHVQSDCPAPTRRPLRATLLLDALGTRKPVLAHRTPGWRCGPQRGRAARALIAGRP